MVNECEYDLNKLIGNWITQYGHHDRIILTSRENSLIVREMKDAFPSSVFNFLSKVLEISSHRKAVLIETSKQVVRENRKLQYGLLYPQKYNVVEVVFEYMIPITEDAINNFFTPIFSDEGLGPSFKHDVLMSNCLSVFLSSNGGVVDVEVLDRTAKISLYFKSYGEGH